MNIGDKILDISHWNTIDWHNLDPSIVGVMIKITDGSRTNYSISTDQANKAIAKGLPVGYYHFAEINGPDVVADAKIEADFFLATIAKLPKSQLVNVLDIEVNKSALAPAQVLSWIQTYSAEVSKAGESLMIYSYADFLNHLPAGHTLGNSLPLWLAGYTKSPILPRGWKTYSMWQYTNTGKIAGSPTPVDLSLVNSLNILKH